ncbi:hypothetical protein GCM10022257_09580 [Hyunsoonleella aestuarii]|uniref:Uncharacterized protein n=1 Tax=Hyunsoonleella aestuarii TaxID=912802 RepID=A0ABP8E9E7_9FLAO
MSLSCSKLVTCPIDSIIPVNIVLSVYLVKFANSKVREFFHLEFKKTLIEKYLIQA